jgi:HD-like signal output (HDOD) protein
MRVMRVANSNFYGTGKQARDLAEAARRIGMSAVKNIALAAATVDHFADANPTGLVPQRFWEHSLACAMLSELLAQAADRLDKEQLFLAGLLHDIGRLVLSSIFPAEYEHVAAAVAQGTPAEAIERDVFGLTHADATRAVMHLWKVPAALIDAGSLHELPVERIQRAVRDPHPALIVALANRLAHALALGDSGNPVLLDTGEHARALGLPREVIRSVATQTVERTETTTLFYASRSQEEFREPLAGELRRSAEREFKLAVLADDPGTPGCDASQTFFERLGWLDAARPQLAVLSLRAAGELPARTRELQALDAAVGRRLPIVVVSGERGLELPAPLTEGRLSAVVPMPVRYVALIESLARVARPEP